MNDKRILVLPGEKAVLAENGPLHLVIQAWSGKKPEIEKAREAADYAFDCLASVAEALPVLKKRHGLITGSLNRLPVKDIAKTMIESVRRIGDEDLTPMAAVAGTIADYTADCLFQGNITRVIVDNGGDIAIRLSPGESVVVGLRPVIESSDLSHVIRIDSRYNTWGVNTSGMGGRSFTRGIASAVTVFAATSSLADAAATAIANACSAEHENIRRRPANSIDPNTDLGDMTVTVGFSDLPEETFAAALEKGLIKALDTMMKGHIRGAVLAVGGMMALTPGFRENVGDITPYETFQEIR